MIKARVFKKNAGISFASVQVCHHGWLAAEKQWKNNEGMHGKIETMRTKLSTEKGKGRHASSLVDDVTQQKDWACCIVSSGSR